MVFGVTCLPFAPSPHLSTHSKKTPKNTTVNFPSLTGLLLATPSPRSVIMLWAETPQTWARAMVCTNTFCLQCRFKVAWTDQEAAAPTHNLFSKIGKHFCYLSQGHLLWTAQMGCLWKKWSLKQTNLPKWNRPFPEHHALLGVSLQQIIVPVVKN